MHKIMAEAIFFVSKSLAISPQAHPITRISKALTGKFGLI